MKGAAARSLSALVFGSACARTVEGAFLKPRADNGLVLTPPMGWNTYNHYACLPNETIVLSNAQALVDLGLNDVGYYYVTTDCGWTVSERTDNGTLTWNASLFPSGLPEMGRKIHELGLGFGVYSDAGVQMCMNGLPNQTGSLYHESVDANTFSAWKADLLKYDNCYSVKEDGYPDADYSPPSPISPRMTTMASALKATGRSIMFAICDWGVDFPSAWAPKIGNTWRITNDIIPAWRTIARIINQAVPQTSYAGPGRWLDLDMLEIGNHFFNEAEEQTHMSLWSIIKSPLIIGTALKDEFTSISKNSLAILSNEDVIGFNQDSLGVAASFRRRWTEDEYEVWAGPLSGGRTVAALVNWRNKTRSLALDLPDIGIQRAATVKSVWDNGTKSSNVLTWYGESVPAHGTMLLELSMGSPAGTYEASHFAYTKGNRTVFENVYGITSSKGYAMSIAFDLQKKTYSKHMLAVQTSCESGWTTNHTSPNTVITVPITLDAINNNTITLESSLSLPIKYISIQAPNGTYYPSTYFALTGSANRTRCHQDLCKPVGSKIGNISPSGGASISMPRGPSDRAGPKYVEIDFTNNDIALSTSWTNGTNTRNLTIAVNEVTTRIELPISGRSSELFSPGRGWEDTGTFGVLLDGFGTGKKTSDEVIVSNIGGEHGIQPQGAEFVGMRVF
ncbi:putative alpha-galactosidase D [Rhizodiscina lignyota]|uniref:Alpha-galactosidase n=1 Tax=Rhizodiscina lignyota TaxID=1504668 RepID=A0A9P4IDA2_9PEZI|nr:putative alpha-galactosidase D [Rhizodiscina lignyota]